MDARRDPHQVRRERWWRSAFIVLATVYVALLLLGLLARILARDLLAAVGEQRSVAEEIGESAAELRGAADRLADDAPKEGAP